MEKFLIKSNDAGQRLDKYIFKLVPCLPKVLLFKSIRKKDIKLNGKRTEASAILKEGDIVELYIHSKFFIENNSDFLQAPPELDIVYEDENIILLNKPFGMLMHQGNENSKDNLTNRLLHYLYKNNEYNPAEELTFSPAFCNRIDRNTTGLVLAGKNFPTLQLLNEKIKNREIEKFYLCWVNGILEEKENILKAFHKKDSNENKAIICSICDADSKEIVTAYKTIKACENSSLLDVELITGRFHQIRAHLGSIGHPIIGDHKYGDTSKTRGQKLCAYKLVFNFSGNNSHLDYLKGKSFSLNAYQIPFDI